MTQKSVLLNGVKMTHDKRKKSHSKDLEVKSKKRPIKTSEKKIKNKLSDKKSLPKQPNKLSIKELRRRSDLSNDQLHKAIKYIFNEDGLSPEDAPFVSYLLNLVFKYDVLFDETSSPSFIQLNKSFSTNNLTGDDFEYYQDVLLEIINRQTFLSSTRSYISSRAGGKYKLKLKTINQSWRT